MRPHVDTTLHRRDGSPAAGATARFRQRGTATDINVYDAPTAGSLVSQPITADSYGRITGYLDTDAVTANTGVDIVYVVDGTTYTEPWAGETMGFEWHSVSFQNSWADFAGGHATAQYGKTNEGIVHIKGLIKTGAVGTVAFQLPAGFRPQQARRFGTIASGNVIARVDIATGGNVTVVAGSSTWTSLNNISFPIT